MNAGGGPGAFRHAERHAAGGEGLHLSSRTWIWHGGRSPPCCIASNAVDIPRGVVELRPFTRHLFCAGCGNVYYSRKSSNRKGKYVYYACGRRSGIGPAACGNRATVREDKLMARIQGAMTAAFEDMDGVLEEVAVMAAEALESNRAESSRLKGEIGEADKMAAGLTRLLVDPDIEPLAKKSVGRQIGEWKGKRDGLRQALEGVAVQAVDDMDELMADSGGPSWKPRRTLPG